MSSYESAKKANQSLGMAGSGSSGSACSCSEGGVSTQAIVGGGVRGRGRGGAAGGACDSTVCSDRLRVDFSLQREVSRDDRTVIKLCDLGGSDADPLTAPGGDGPKLARLVALAEQEWSKSWRGSVAQSVVHLRNSRSGLAAIWGYRSHARPSLVVEGYLIMIQ